MCARHRCARRSAAATLGSIARPHDPASARLRSLAAAALRAAALARCAACGAAAVCCVASVSSQRPSRRRVSRASARRVSAAPYEGAARELVAALKFGPGCRSPLSPRRRWRDALAGDERIDRRGRAGGAGRRRARGFDPAEVIAAALAACAGLDARPACARRDGPRQVGPRSRRPARSGTGRALPRAVSAASRGRRRRAHHRRDPVRLRPGAARGGCRRGSRRRLRAFAWHESGARRTMIEQQAREGRRPCESRSGAATSRSPTSFASTSPSASPGSSKQVSELARLEVEMYRGAQPLDQPTTRSPRRRSTSRAPRCAPARRRPRCSTRSTSSPRTSGARSSATARSAAGAPRSRRVMGRLSPPRSLSRPLSSSSTGAPATLNRSMARGIIDAPCASARAQVQGIRAAGRARSTASSPSSSCSTTPRSARAPTSCASARARTASRSTTCFPRRSRSVREAGKRALGQRHYDVQLIGGMVLHSGAIAEMRPARARP